MDTITLTKQAPFPVPAVKLTLDGRELTGSSTETLIEIADREGMPLSRFVATLHDEVLTLQGDVGNFASFLRVTCLHYLRNIELHTAQVAARSAALVPEMS